MGKPPSFPDDRARPQPSASRVLRPDATHRDEIADLLTAAGEAASRDRCFTAAVGREVDEDLALDWWLHASDHQLFVSPLGDRIAAVAVAVAPDAHVSTAARLRWLVGAVRRAGPEAPWRILRRLRASERHRPSAPHFHVPVLAVHPDFRGEGHERALLDAVQAGSAAHPTSTGVCLETGDASASALLQDLGYQPSARFRGDGDRQTALFRPDAGAAPFPDPVRVPIEDSIDLHRYRPAEIADVVVAYLEAASEAGLRELRIIHGRGKGVQRHRVQRLLARDARVERFAEAPPDRGGRGATLVWLAPPERERR